MDPDQNLLPPYISTGSLARGVSIAMGVLAGVAWISAGCDVAEIWLILREWLGGHVAPREIAATNEVGSGLWILKSLLLIGTCSGFLYWLYTARVNVRAMGVRHLDFPRIWSVASFFVPLLNFRLPYHVVREIWQASDPNVVDPFHWRTVSPPRLLDYWWNGFLCSLVLNVLAYAMVATAGGSPIKLLIAYAVSALADSALAVATSLAYFVINEVSRAQDEKYAALVRA